MIWCCGSRSGAFDQNVGVDLVVDVGGKSVFAIDSLCCGPGIGFLFLVTRSIWKMPGIACQELLWSQPEDVESHPSDGSIFDGAH